MTDYERSGQPWKDDPATDVISAYHGHVSEELGTDGPLETFGHPDESRVGHLLDDHGLLEDDVPEEWSQYTQANVDFFDNIGSPGGASKMGKIDHDVDFIAALPPQQHDE